MADWVEELKLQRTKEIRNDHYQQYQDFLNRVDEMDKIDASEQVGATQGRSFKKLESANLTILFNRSVNNTT